MSNTIEKSKKIHKDFTEDRFDNLVCKSDKKIKINKMTSPLSGEAVVEFIFEVIDTNIV